VTRQTTRLAALLIGTVAAALGCSTMATNRERKDAEAIRAMLMQDSEVAACYELGRRNLAFNHFSLNYDELGSVWQAKIVCDASRFSGSLSVTVSSTGVVLLKRRGL
jgi:hypothetical protein